MKDFFFPESLGQKHGYALYTGEVPGLFYFSVLFCLGALLS